MASLRESAAAAAQARDARTEQARERAEEHAQARAAEALVDRLKERFDVGTDVSEVTFDADAVFSPTVSVEDLRFRLHDRNTQVETEHGWRPAESLCQLHDALVYEPPEAPPEDPACSEPPLGERLLDLLTDAVADRLRERP